MIKYLLVIFSVEGMQMILENMILEDINFGEIEGKREFDSSEKILHLFYEEEYKNYLHKFLDGSLRYIYGLKGTGKTSLLKYLEDHAERADYKTIYISYKDFKEEADVIDSFRTELKDTDDKDTYALTFWRWYILSLLSKAFLNESKYDTNNLIYMSKVKFFQILSKVLDIITEISVKTGETSFNLTMPNISGLKVKWETQTADRIRCLETNLKENLDFKAILFIDELELSKASSTSEIDLILIKNLIRAVRKINNLTNNFHIILAVRSEILNNIALSGDEINKEFDDFGYEIEWHRRKFDISHPLIKIIIHKIRYAMQRYVIENKIELENPINKLTDEQIWLRWFPANISTSAVSSPEFLLQNTWLRPRDFSRLLKIMKRYSMGMNKFTQSSYDEAIKKFGEDSWKEIKEELSIKYSPASMGIIENILIQLQILFLKKDFLAKALEKGIATDSANDILNDLYRLSAIGNHYRTVKYNKVQTIYRYFSRNDKILYDDKAIIVHKAIEKGLGLNDFKSELLTCHWSQAEKKQYLNSPNDGFFSLNDHL